MDELENKYHQLHLSSSELDELKERVNTTSDEKLVNDMHECWEQGVTVQQADTDSAKAVWQRVSKRILPQETGMSQKKTRIGHWLQIAAAVIIPVLLISLGYQYHHQQQLAQDVMTVTTEEGEQVSLSLPDGTRIKLNEFSRVTYHPHVFSATNRHIDFIGEAYFDVRKDSLHPFNINADGMDITVKGTKFNLKNYPQQATADLSLIEGSVILRAQKTGQEITLRPGQRSILDKVSGHLAVEEMREQLDNVTAWKSHQLVFRNVSLRDVLKTIQKTYDVDISIQTNLNLSDLFTGTISSSDLNGSLEVLEQIYHCKAIVSGKRVTICR